MLENFKRKEHIPSYFLTNITSQDKTLIEQACRIYDVSLGQKYIPIEDLLYYAHHPEKYFVIGAITPEMLLGVMLAYQLEEKEVSTYDKELESHNIPPLLYQYQVGLIKSVAVKPGFRHMGIGTSLTAEVIEQLRGRGCNAIYSISWDSGKPESSPKMFKKLGFTQLKEVTDYWREDSLRAQYTCPNCGDPPCHCSAIFYFKQISD